MATAADIAYRVWGDLGKIDALEEFIASGGSTTTIVNGNIADRQDRPDDNYSIDFTAIVVRDAGGANAAPEGEMQRIEGYASGTYTHTVDTAFTVAPASGDLIAIANADIPLREMYRAINNALSKIGEIPLVNSSLTSADSQTEYTLPVALKREDLIRVEYQGYTEDANDNQWTPIPNWDVIPAAPGSTALLILPQIPSGRTIRLVYMGVHPTITTYSSVISEYIHPAILIAAVTKEALRWYNASTSGKSNYWLQKENEAAQDMELALRKHPIWTPNYTPRFSTFPMRNRYGYNPELDATKTGY